MTLRISATAGLVAALALVASGTAHAGDLSQPGPDVGRSVGSAPAARLAGPVTIGQTGPPGSCGGTQPRTAAMVTEGTGAPSYVMPSAGVLTSFSHSANSTAGQVRAVVFTPSPTPGHLTLVNKSDPVPVAPSTLNSFPIRIPVRAGQMLGLTQTANNMGCVINGVTGDQVGSATFDPDASSDYTPDFPAPNLRLNISAVLEPDVDGDQYGDVSQDACPQSALTQAACPAPKTRKKGRPSLDAKGRAVFKFKSSIAGSTFQCRVDKRAVRACTSPLRKRLGPGKHKVRVQAISPAGIVDPTPLKLRITIRR